MTRRNVGRVLVTLSVLMVAASLVTDGGRSILFAVSGVSFAAAALSTMSGGTR